MKKIYILLGLITMGMSSCESFLDEQPIDKVAKEQFYTDEAGLMKGLTGVYDILGATKVYGTDFLGQIEASSDESYRNRSAETSGFPLNLYNFTDGQVSAMWTQLYDGVQRANAFIADVNVPKMDETKRQQMLGEALFLRGYYYFMLVSRWGDVPLRLTPTTSPVGIDMARTPKAEVYAQILKDMKEAETKVATSTSIGYSSRVSKTIVQGILARVCLYMAGNPLNDTSKYAEALEWTKKVINSGEHGLNVTFDTDPKFNSFNQTIATVPVNSNNAYRQIFINLAQNKYDLKENMWEIEFKGNRTDSYNELGGLGSQVGFQFQPAVGSPFRNSIGYGYGFARATHRLFNSYDATGKDLRRDWNLSTYNFNGTTGARQAMVKTIVYGREATKWKREYEITNPKDQNQSSINFAALRYADILLMFAEAENKVLHGPSAAAYEAVNQVRRRGYGLPINTPSLVADLPVGLNEATFQQWIEDERMRELCFEGLRRMDLIRWGKYVQTMNAIGNEMASAPTVFNALTGPLAAQNVQYAKIAGQSTAQKHLLYPIPSVEMLSNKLITPADQNPGW
ncbi:Starch-binding associating with outer membrane [Flavobacterium fluvii]|uniref:Starch-binding associating with outer membrane n=1 Tax=Flavobacterium fluvii TaxID=468056 RepID=A0A1M5HF13_9FLAO|nr:RagB/SusD family nutrient uptake outer membrane protein [Flavobacterium fluvii]SHG14533.1 Starch-binding associating with outer membrane [Flavobacterium fluvii]